MKMSYTASSSLLNLDEIVSNPAFRGMNMGEVISVMTLPQLRNLLGLSMRCSKRMIVNDTLSCETFKAWSNRRSAARYNNNLYRWQSLARAELKTRDRLVEKHNAFLNKFPYGKITGVFHNTFKKLASTLGYDVEDYSTCKRDCCEPCSRCWQCEHMCTCVDELVSTADAPWWNSRCKYCKSKYGEDCACTLPSFEMSDAFPFVSSNMYIDATRFSDSYIKSLKAKVRVVIVKLQSIRIGNVVDPEKFYMNPPNFKWFSSSNPLLDECYEMREPEGDKPEEKGSSPSLDKKSNVVLEEVRDQAGVPMLGPQRSWITHVSNDKITSIQNLTERWFTIGSFQWSNDHTVGQQIYSVELPNQAMYSVDGTTTKSNACNKPQFAPFNVHMYSNPSLEIAIAFNGNKFQVGSLQCSWIYQDDCDAHNDKRLNLATLSQTEMFTISAATEEQVHFKIPYMHSTPVLYNNATDMVDKYFNLGTLRIRVLNPLAKGANLPSILHGSVLMRFTDVQFTGMRDATIAYPSAATMHYHYHHTNPEAGVAEVATTVAAMKLIDTVLSDPNRDNPPLNVEARYFVPTGTHSWSAGTGRPDVNKILRLDTAGQTHHPDPVIPADAMTVSNLAGKFGLVTQYKITKTMTRGAHVIYGGAAAAPTFYGLAVEPTLGGIYGTVATSTSPITQYFTFAPVAVISSLFALWRGSLKFKFDIISNQYQTCKLLIAYIPNVTNNVNVTLDQATSSPHIIVDIKEQQQVVFQVPYIAPVPWWPRAVAGNYDSANFNAPSRLYMFLYNPLLNINAASDHLYINMYVAAGDDFEVSVPAQPSIGLCVNTSYVDNHPISPNQDPIYAGAWNKFLNDQYYCLRYQTTSITTDGVAAWPEPPKAKKGIAYYYVCDGTSDALNGTYQTKGGKFERIQYGVLCNQLVNWWWMILCKNEADAKTLAQYFVEAKYTLQQLTPYMVETPTSTANNTWSTKGVKWSIKEHKFKSDLNAYVIPEGESSSQESPLVITGQRLPSTNCGFDYFGENFNDLMTLCRRYQLYTSIQLTRDVLNNQNQCAFYFTCNPTGLLLDTSIPVFNRLREGVIPILLSAYRYFRGGLRFRLVFPQCINTTIWVQHRPDRRTNPRGIWTCSSVDSGQGLMNHGYAMELQLANVNSIVEVEIPFYQFGQYGLLQSPTDAGQLYDFQYGLGQIVVGIQACKEDAAKFENKMCDVYYALADDFTPYLYYGFPPMVSLQEVPQLVTIRSPEGMLDAVVAEVKDTKAMLGFTVENSATRVADAIVEGMTKNVDTVCESISQGLAANTAEVCNTVKDSFSSSTQVMLENLNSNFSNTASKLNVIGSDVTQGITDLLLHANDITYKQIILNVVSNILHMVNSKDINALAIGICSILANFGLFAWEKLSNCISVLKTLFSSWFAHFHSDGATQPPSCAMDPLGNLPVRHLNPEGAKDDTSHVASWVSLIFTAICALLGCTLGMPKTMKSTWVHIFDSVGNACRSGSFVYNFVSKTFDLIKRIYYWVMCKVSPEYKCVRLLQIHTKVLSAWSKEVMYLMDPIRFEDESSDVKYHDRVWTAYEFGRTILTLIPESLQPIPQFVTLYKLFDKLEKLRADLNALGINNHVRKMPTVIYMSGPPGIGKSFLTHPICNHLIKECRIPIKSRDIYFTLSASSKYWNQCRRQPVMVIDDLWAVKEGTLLEQQMQTMFELVTEQPLAPPKAALEDKNMLYNPELVYICSNEKYANFNNVNNEALNRRRNVLIECRIHFPIATSDLFNVDCPHCTKHEVEFSNFNSEQSKLLTDFHHMEFKIHSDVREENWSEESRWLSYAALLDEVTPIVLDHREKAQRQYLRKIKELDELVDEFRINQATVFEQLFLGDTDHDETLSFDVRYERIIRDLKKELDEEMLRTIKSDWNVFSTWTSEKWDNFKAKCASFKISNFLKHKNPAHNELEPEGEDSVDVPVNYNPFDEDDDKAAGSSNMPINVTTLNNIQPKLRKDVNCNIKIKDIDYWKSMAAKGHKVKMAAYQIDKNDLSHISGWTQDEMEFLRPALHVLKALRHKYSKDFIILIVENKNRFVLNDMLNFIQFLLTYNSYIMRVVYSFKDVILNFSNMRHICNHLSLDLSVLDYVDSKLLAPGCHYDLQFPCENVADCICSTSVGMSCFYAALVDENVPIRLALRRNDKLAIPAFLHSIHFSQVPWMSMWEQLLKWCDQFYDKYMADPVNKIVKFIEKFGKLILGALAIGASASVIGGLGYMLNKESQAYVSYVNTKADVMSVSNGLSPSWRTPLPQSQPEGVYSNSTIRPTPSGPKLVTPEGVQQVDVCLDRLRQNAVQLTLYFDEDQTRKMLKFRAIVIGGRSLLFIRHFYEWYMGIKKTCNNVDLKLTFTNRKIQQCSDGISIELEKCPQHILTYNVDSKMADSNIIIFELPPQIPACRDLRKFICPAAALPMASMDCILVQFNDRDVAVVAERKCTARGAIPAMITPAERHGTMSTPVILTDTFEYPYHGYGVCGSILISTNLQTPILGIHVAGHGGIGTAELLTQEAFVAVKQREVRPTPFNEISIPKFEESYAALFHVESDIVEVAKMRPSDVHRETGKTAIVKSPLYAKIVEPRTAPNPLKAGPPLPPNVDPLYEGVKKHGILVKDFSQKTLSRAVEYLNDFILVNCKPIRMSTGLLDWQTVVCGNPDVKEFDALNWNSSAGFPLSNMKPQNSTGKKWCFDLQESNSGYICNSWHPALQAIYNIDHGMRINKTKPCTIFTDCLKDTTLPIEKCALPGKTRIFSISPLQFTLECRRYFGDFMASFRSQRLDLMHGIGIDVNSREWSDLLSRLLVMGDKVCVGDYSNFGPGLNATVAYEACHIMCNWMKHYDTTDTKEQNDNVRRIIVEELVCSMHLAHDLIYYAPGGLPSGSPFTDILNSIVNILYVLCAFIELTKLSPYDFNKYVCLYVYGDDLIMSLSDTICEIFNTKILSEWLATYDIKFTDISKTGEIFKYKNIFECDFLKRRWTPHPYRPDVFLAPLDQISVESPINWVNQKELRRDRDVCLIQNCESALLNAFAHGETYFNNLKSKILHEFFLLNIKHVFKSWSEVDRMFYDR